MQQNVFALGFFDGVHRGHGALLQTTAARARERALTPAAFTFDRAPKEAVFGTPVPLISTPRERELLMRRLYGMETVVFAPFDRAMMTMPWEEFVEFLCSQHGAAHLVAGDDFRFGYQNAGDSEKLQKKCRALGIGCDIVPPVQLDGVTVSSTHIRSLLQEGDIVQANRFLAHPHLLCRTVAHGLRIGRTIGIPTVNFPAAGSLALPRDGVYLTTVTLPDARSFVGVTNVGCRPTVAGRSRTVETFLLDFTGDLYGAELCLAFRERLREEEKFPSLDALRRRIETDIRIARERLPQALPPFSL